jgi:SAM-dependent methyltransferase
METAEIRQVVDRLIGSIWAYDALCFAVEKGILVQLNEPRSLANLSEHSGVPTTLLERVLDVLVSVNLIHRDKDVFVIDKGMLPLITEPVKTFYLANLLANYFEGKDLMDNARKGSITLGWDFTEPDILQSVGFSSSIQTEFFVRELAPKLGDLASRLQSPSARFLDVGSGVGAISIAACRLLPNLHVVGLEPQEASLAVASQNIAAVRLTDRIELRKQRVEDMADTSAFDLAYFPQLFMPDDVVKLGVRNTWKALRPGGWIMLLVICVPGMELPATISRLRDTLFGGGARFPAQVEVILNEAGFTSVSTFKFPRGETYNIVVGQRPN